MALPVVMQLATRAHARVVYPHMLACSTRGAFLLRARTRSSPRGRRALRTLAAGDKPTVVFLGTPQVAADVLERLLQTAGQDDACFEVAAVVSQPGKAKGRGRTIQPTPVTAMALEYGVAEELIFTPLKAREPEFLERMEALAPDLCVTAAYGNMLPQRFLDIPKHGTLNIHPSLLPQFRGAAPVQRALEAGVAETGVSVAYTVLACDAGPVLAAERMSPDDDIQHPQLLTELFRRGTELLLKELPGALDGSAVQRAVPQDESGVTHADKVSAEEALLDFSQPALTLHNKVRGFAGWPGTKATFAVENKQGGEDMVTVKVVLTRLAAGPRKEGATDRSVTFVGKKALQVACDDGSLIEILELQPPGKKVQPAADFWNGLQGRAIRRT